MTVVLSVPSQAYTPRTVSIQRNIPASVKKIKFSFTRESWPAGIDYLHPDGSIIVRNCVIAISLLMPDGSAGGGATFAGGDLFRDVSGKRVSPVSGFRVAQDGSLVPAPEINILITEDFYDPTFNSPGGTDFPPGQYTFIGRILVPLTTSVVIERF